MISPDTKKDNSSFVSVKKEDENTSIMVKSNFLSPHSIPKRREFSFKI